CQLFTGETGDRVVLAAGPAERVPHPQAQFLYVKGLGNVINRAQLKTGNAIITTAALGDKNNWEAAGPNIFLEMLTHFKTIKVRQANIKQDEVRRFRP